MKQDDPTRTVKLVKLSDICGEFGVNFVFSTKIEHDQVIQFVTQLDPLVGGHGNSPSQKGHNRRIARFMMFPRKKLQVHSERIFPP